MEKIKIIRFGGDFRPAPERQKELKSLVEQCDNLYPGIEIWYKRKVVKGLEEKERTAYILYENSTPVGATILKKGERAKICSLRILPSAEKKGYGKILMALVARDMRLNAKWSHFTIPEHIWEEKRHFFEEYGFEMLGIAGSQYRLFDQELFCKAPFGSVWKKAVKCLPELLKNISVNGVKIDYDLVMSVHSSYAKAIVSGKKRVEIRTRFSDKWVGSHTLVYSTAPVNSFVGSFRISGVIFDSPNSIWDNFSTEIWCNKDEFLNYTKGNERVYAIILTDFFEFKQPLHKPQLSHIVDSDIKIPQSYSNFKNNPILEEAISIGTLLHSTL
ncbi:MAG: GNAT family N-acetyltransferase [Candidatus Zixiibacteriota bacterium]